MNPVHTTTSSGGGAAALPRNGGSNNNNDNRFAPQQQPQPPHHAPEEDDDDTFSGDFFRRMMHEGSHDTTSHTTSDGHRPNGYPGNHHHHDDDDHHYHYDDYDDDDEDEEDEGDLNSEAREYYNSGASELVTTVRGDGYGGGGSHHDNDNNDEITGLRQQQRRHNNNTMTTSSKYQSHNYEPDESEVWRAYVAQQHFANRGQWWTTGKLRALKRWMLTLVVGVTQAIIAVTCNIATKNLMQAKYDHVYDLMEYHRLYSSSSSDASPSSSSSSSGYYTADGYLDIDQDGIPDSEEQYQFSGGDTIDDVNDHLSRHWFNFGKSPYLTFLFYQTLFVLCATLFVYIEPVSGGSGIPDIKCYLNGIDVPRIVDFKTLVCRVMGVTFSVAAGLPVGKEGPMVHSGGVVAAVISQGRTKFWGVDTSFSKFSDFRNDREKRGEY